LTILLFAKRSASTPSGPAFRRSSRWPTTIGRAGASLLTACARAIAGGRRPGRRVNRDPGKQLLIGRDARIALRDSLRGGRRDTAGGASRQQGDGAGKGSPLKQHDRAALAVD
jgi:hypothetical protein